MIGEYMTKVVLILFAILTIFAIYFTYTGASLQEVEASSSTAEHYTSTRGGSYGHWSGGGGGYSYGK